jgi:starch synthase
MNQGRLKIGYIMQANAVDMSVVSGAQQHVKAVIGGLEKRGHRVRVVAIQQGQIQWTDDLSEWHSAEFGFSESRLLRLIESPVRAIQSRLQLPFFRFFDSYRFSDACVSVLNGYDILYERDSTISYGGLIAARRLGIPIVIEVNGDLIEEWEHIGLQFSSAQRKVVHLITRQIYHRASHVIAVGETIRERLVDRWDLDPSHVSVVTNGADVDLFLKMDEASSLRERHLIQNRPVAIFVGGFQPWHGVDLIYEGFRQAACTIPHFTMLFVGDGPLRSRLQEEVDTSGLREQVLFAGRVEHTEVARLLNAADVAVIYHRGSAADIVETPLKLFEYMAAGKAIIAPAVRNMKRILTDRVNALLIPPDNPTALADALVTLIEDSQLRESLGQAARREAIAKHSWARAVSELEVILYARLERSGKNLQSE